MLRRLSRIVSFVAAGALLLAGCGDEQASASSSGELTVFAATSLTGAFTDLAQRFEDARNGVSVTLNFAASSALVQQVREGAPADVVAFADSTTMSRVRHLVRAPVVFARNRLVIVTKPGNPTRIRSVADLQDAPVLSLCGAEVPCGKYAAEALRKAGVTVDESRISRGQNAGATLGAVAEGDATAAIVYTTDAIAIGAKVSVVRVPARHNVVAAYPIATRKDGALARAFVDYVQSRAGQRVLRAHGFLAA